MIWVLVVSLVVLTYVFAGYPLLLRALVRIRGARAIRRADITPSVTLVISAYNEAGVIGEKLENALALDYPRDAFTIVVISDASDDGTDEIVTRFADRGVILRRQAERGGKTRGLNVVLPTLSSELIVFSDANAIYQPDALLRLARNFADPDVGCVTGEARYLAGNDRAADRGERAYWDYEIQIKKLETAVGSMVGGDGAIYAIRRTLWQQLPDDAINDFLNPLQIAAAGRRCVYEPDAVCYEETAGRISSEYRRRVRIVSRSWRAVFLARGVLNPWRVGLFAWCVVSHKLLRWLSIVPLTLGAVAATSLAVQQADATAWWAIAAVAFTGLAAIGVSARGRRAASTFAYFYVVNAASLVGVVKGSLGNVSGIWTTPRQPATAADPQPSLRFAVGRLFLVTVIGAAGVLAFVIASRDSSAGAASVFWLSVIVLAYVYVGYPLLLAAWSRIAPRPVHRAPFEPTVCLLIAAHNEAAVIRGKLHNTLALEYPAERFDVVVASDGSSDGTNEIIRSFAPRVRLLDLSPRQGKIGAINQAVADIRSEIVVLSDANTFLEPDAIRALVGNFADPAVGAVSGDVALVGDRASLGRSEDLYYRYERMLQRLESEIGSMIGADGALYAIRRQLFSAPAADTILDDLAIPMAVIRRGRRVVFEPRAVAAEQGSETAAQEFSRKSRVIAGAVQFLSRGDSTVPLHDVQVTFSLLSHKALRWLSPAFATLAFLSSLTLVNVSHGYAAAAAGQGMLFALGLAGCVPRFRRISVIALAHYFCLVQTAAVVGLLRGITGRQSVLWQRFAREAPPASVEVVR